ALVAGVHARPALDAVLELEVDAARLVFRVALRRAHVRRAVVGADRVADRRVDDDVRLRLGAALVAVADLAAALGDGKRLGFRHGIEVGMGKSQWPLAIPPSPQSERAARAPSLTRSQSLMWAFRTSRRIWYAFLVG